ncbi:MAG TPA: ATP-binding protein [Spirochaetota bacterium]|nr:ATP-binding protein [Spirochaetota bacterium]
MFRFVRNIKISRRLGIFFQITIIPMIILFGAFVYVTNTVNELENRIMSDNVRNIRAVYNLQLSLLRLRRLNANYIIMPDAKYLKAFRDNVNEFNKWLRESSSHSTDSGEIEIISSISDNFSKYLSKHDEIVKLMKNNDKTRAIQTMLSEGNNYYYSIYDNCETLIGLNDRKIDALENKVEHYLSLSRRFGYVTIVIFLVMGTVAYIVVSRSIMEPIREMESASNTFKTPESAHMDELEALKSRFQNMMKTIRKNREQLIRTEKRAAVGQIAAGISHELNNPIGIIAGLAEMLSRNGHLSAKDKKLAAEIFRESQRCRVLLGDFLNFAKTPDPHMRKTDITRVLRQLIQSYSQNDLFSGISFTFRSDAPSMTALVDPMQIRQVFVNIVINARDAMNGKGTISINCAYSKNGMTIAFKDTGHGIPREIAKRIFDPFFSTKKKGTGLGLAISHDIIDRHAGKLYCAQVKEGAQFMILLTKGVYGKKTA